MSLKGKKYIKDTFCIAPWTEMHFGVQKEVLPCCKYNNQHSFGNLNSTNDLEEIYNSEKAKYIRSSLFSGNRPIECNSCWKDEELSKNQSYREFHNEYYGGYIEEALENTNDDFSLKKITLRRLDIRFDNKCNLKCRICNSDYSTSWYMDDVKLGRKPKKKTDVYQQSISSKVFDFIIDQLKNVDEIFFAGGEPLMQDGHYLILEKAIELGYNHKIRLTYNTNFSSLKYKKKDIISLWKQFQFVNIGASLDASHKQGEYQRKNIIWDDVVENRRTILKELPDANFNIIPTVGILNVYNILEFHKEWVELGLLDINRIDINLLSEPKGYNIQDLPDYHKERILKLYNTHIEWIKTHDDSDKAVNEFTKVINYIKKEGSFKYLSHFLEFNKKLDSIRDESFFEVFPEYSDLEWYIKYTKLVETVGDKPLETIGALNEKVSKQYEYIRELEILRDKLNKKIAEKDSFISKTLHETSYVKELEEVRDNLNKKIAEKDSFISKTLIESNYVKELEEVRDNLNKKIAEKDSFINKTLIESNYVDELSKIKKSLNSINKDSVDDLNTFFDDIEAISIRLTSKIKKISRENGYKSIL